MSYWHIQIVCVLFLKKQTKQIQLQLYSDDLIKLGKQCIGKKVHKYTHKGSNKVPLIIIESISLHTIHFRFYPFFVLPLALTGLT